MLFRSRSAGGYLDGVGPRLAQAFLDRGLLLRPLGNVLYVMPPYVTTPAEVDGIMAAIREELTRLSREVAAAGETTR